jgi:hypothetical protein
MKLSQWHDGSVKPVHVGVYELETIFGSNMARFSFFDGYFWHGWNSQIEFNSGTYPDKSDFIISFQGRKWRGIVKDKK